MKLWDYCYGQNKARKEGLDSKQMEKAEPQLTLSQTRKRST